MRPIETEFIRYILFNYDSYNIYSLLKLGLYAK